MDGTDDMTVSVGTDRAATTAARPTSGSSGTGRKVGFAALGLGIGAGLGALVGMRGGTPLRGAAMGAALVGGVGFLAGCAPGRPTGREVGTVPTTVTYSEPTGSTHVVTGRRRDADGVEREYRETVTEYHQVERNVLARLLVSGETRHPSLDAYLGSVDLSAAASDYARGLVVVRREDSGVLVGRGRSEVGGSMNSADVEISDPDTVAVIGPKMYLESSDYEELEHPVTFGSAATASDRRAIGAELG